MLILYLNVFKLSFFTIMASVTLCCYAELSQHVYFELLHKDFDLFHRKDRSYSLGQLGVSFTFKHILTTSA